MSRNQTNFTVKALGEITHHSPLLLADTTKWSTCVYIYNICLTQIHFNGCTQLSYSILHLAIIYTCTTFLRTHGILQPYYIWIVWLLLEPVHNYIHVHYALIRIHYNQWTCCTIAYIGPAHASVPITNYPAFMFNTCDQSQHFLHGQMKSVHNYKLIQCELIEVHYNHCAHFTIVYVGPSIHQIPSI